ncbi:unnamed protein product [Bursaphelenchus xylophilus]|uniref:DNA-directed DNA polymerase n=1 Tax=Bursaphelenchus xylophilus TaxID=6326 RepID=A0A811M055_BURXY|nr:unnamed protein product [Bursaphelenchus xylophilus]CAG9131874.1 unnamed protein product [Bursaphelenchus xylophilus]
MKRPSNEPNHQPSKSRRIDLNKVEQFLLEASSSLLDLPTISEDWHAIPFELEESELYLDGEADSESDESETNIINGVLEYLEEKGASEIRASEGLLQYFKGRADFEKFLQDYLTDIGDFVNCFEDTNTYDARSECLVLQDQKQDYEGGLKTSEGLLNYLKGRTDFEQFLQEYLTDVGDFATTFVEKTSADDARSVCIVHQDQKQDYDRGWRFYVPEMLHEVLYLPWSFDEPENSEIKKDGHARGKPESKLKAMKARIEMEYKWKEELEGSEDVEVEMENSDWILENDLAMSDTEVEEEMDEDILAKDLALSETESEPDKNEGINYREVLMKELELSDSDDESELDTEDSENNSNSGYDDAYDADTSDPEELSNQVGGGNGLTLIAKNFVQNETFPELRLAVSYKMSEASQIDNLEYTFRRIINQMFEDMASEVQRTKPGRDIMRINLSLQGGLLGKTVYTGMQNVGNFSPDLLFTALSKVQQSHRQVNLLGRPFEILMTAYLSRNLRNGDRTGGIRGGHRTDGATGYNQETGVFQYRERRRLCLPLAILICKLYHGTERYGNKSRTAHQMCNTNSRIFKESVAKTLKDLGLPLILHMIWRWSRQRKRPIGHRCFIPRIDIPDQEPEYKMVIYDFECTQTEVVADDIRKHNVNMACCQVMCQKCMTDGAWKMGQCENCGSEKKFWSIPHESRVPTIITNGERIYDLTLSGGKEFGCLHFRDSINHLNCALSELPSIYPLEEGESGIKKKGDFPHEFNREENYEYVGPYPSLKEYMVEEMMPKKREKLEEWYRTTDKKIFDFKQELLAYCESDVKILAHAVCEHRKAMRELKGKEFEDIWYHSITLASAVMRDYRQSYLPENTLVIQNESKFGNQINQSAVALKFLRYLKKNFLPSLQFRDSPEGEKKLELLIGGKRKKFSADGFVKEGNLVVEFNGCYYHGCPTCNKDPLKIMGSRKTQKASFKDSTERTKALENAGYVVITFWEHEINEELKINKEMDDFFKNELENAGPAHPRDAFFGGRTASLCLYFKKEGNYVMGYLDVNSLYPFILFMVPMPVGEPRIVALNQDCNWTCPEDMGFEKGLYKVFIIPPDDLFIPVIPLKIEKSILYTLCQKCAKKFANSNFVSYEEATCKHSDLERGWSCTLAHIELEEALRNGYRVIRIYEKIVFDEFSENLFKEPIRKFYREKMLASEIPNYLKTSADFDQFLKAYKDGFGIELEVEDWKPNKAKRYNNKIFLNSFWGKFCQRSSLAKLNFCRNEEDYHTIMSNETLEVQRTVILNSNTCAIHVKTKEDFLEDLEFNNIYIAIYTTAAARLHLFRQMKKATEGGAKILYLDTG